MRRQACPRGTEQDLHPAHATARRVGTSPPRERASGGRHSETRVARRLSGRAGPCQFFGERNQPLNTFVVFDLRVFEDLGGRTAAESTAGSLKPTPNAIFVVRAYERSNQACDDVQTPGDIVWGPSVSGCIAAKRRA